MGDQQSTDTDTGSSPTSTSATVEAEGKEFKLLVIGDCGVGKSSLLTRFAYDTFTETYTATTGVELAMRDVVLDGEAIRLRILDAAALERFRTVGPPFYRFSHGIMVVYDVTEQESFDNVKDWLQKIDHYRKTDVTRILVGNRCDETTNKVVDYTTAKEFAELRGIPFLETSAKDGTNVEQAFMMLVVAVKDRMLTTTGCNSNKAMCEVT